MRSISRWKKTIIRSCTAGMLAFTVMAGQNMVTAWAAPSEGTCASDNVVVRESAVSGAMVGGLSEGQEVTIQDEEQGEDGKTWYKITYEVNGEERKGWVRSDLINAAGSESSQGTDNAEGETEDPDETQNGSSVQLQTGNGTVTLTDIPEEETSKISDRFVQSVCQLDEGSVMAYQLSAADELVAEDASLVDFYYVYGTNELGVSGWYVYDASEGTIQRSLINMQYKPEAQPKEDTVSANGFNTDSITKMLIGVLAVVCLLLLVLAIIFSVRYRRLRRILEEETEDEEEYTAPEVQRRTAPGEKVRKEKMQDEKPAKEEHSIVKPEKEPKKETKKRGRSQKDDDLEAILGEAQRQLSMELETSRKKVDLIDLDSADDELEDLEDYEFFEDEDTEFDLFKDFEPKTADGDDSDDQFDKRELDDLERILSREFSAQKMTDIVDEEPEYYDDDDDDLEFL